MGKRKYESESDTEEIQKKIRKLEKKLKKRKEKRRKRRDKSPPSAVTPPGSPNRPEKQNINNDENVNQKKKPEEAPPETEPTDPELDSIILDILGDDPSVVKQYGKDVHNDLVVRFQHLVTHGLSKEIRKELQEKYLPPSNCPFIDAPALNPEIKAAVSEVVLKRDKGIEIKQKELGSAMSCLGEALTVLLSKEDKDTLVIKLLMDAARLIGDCQNADSTTRRNFVLFNVKKEMKDQLQKTKIDKFLFGSDLADTLKTAKIISKSGAELKSTPPAAPKQPAKNKPVAGTSAQFPRNNLNWKAPPPSRRQKGTQRTKEPAPRFQHASSSRTSQRAPPPGRNRR